MPDINQLMAENMQLRGEQERIAGEVRSTMSGLVLLISGSASLGKEVQLERANRVLREGNKKGRAYVAGLGSVLEQLTCEFEGRGNG